MLNWAMLLFLLGTPEPAATVNGEPLPRAAVDAEVKRVRALAGPLSDRQAATLRREILEDLIDDALIRQYLRAETPPLSTEDVAKHWQGLLAALQRRGTTLEAYLQEIGCGEPEFRARHAAQLRFDLFLDKVATEEKLRQYLSDHPEQFDGRRAKIGLIALPVPGDAAAGEKSAAVARLSAIRSEILAARRSFADSAALYSVDRSAANGGDAGWVGVRDALLDERITTTAQSLAVGEVSKPLEVPGAVVLVTTTAKESGTTPEFEAVRELVRERFAEGVRANLITRLRATATVTRSEE